jgi:hypothetical protein
MRSTLLVSVVLATWLAVGCSDQNATTVPPVEGSVLARERLEPVADRELDPAPPAEAPATEAASLELVGIRAETLTVLSGKVICNTSATRPTCLDLSESRYPARGSMYLSVAVTVTNNGSEAQEFRMGELAVSLDGRLLRYDAVSGVESADTTIQPLAEGTAKSVFEVPVDVLNRGSFGVVLGGGEPVAFEFDQPSAQEERQAIARAEQAAKEEIENEQERQSNARIDKCWALNRADTPQVSEEEFAWYIENCSNLYDVGTYALYLARRAAR